MQSPSLDIERIVQEVLRRLAQDGSASSEEASRIRELVIPERVITLRQIEGRLQGVAQVVAPSGAVVTPSVRDELRSAGIELKHCSQLSASRSIAPQASPRAFPWLLIDGTLPPGLAPAASIVPPERRKTTQDLASVLRDAASELTGNRWVVITTRAMAVTALANRYGSLRAAHIREAEDLEVADRQLGANVLVLDTMLAPLLRRTLAFASQAPSPAPPLLRQEAQA